MHVVMSDAELLRAAIAASGLSVRKFAVVLVRDPRTLFRWLSGESPLPKAVRERCEQLVAVVTQPSDSG